MGYEEYMFSDNPKVRDAYFEGCRNILTIFRATSANDYPKLWSSLTEDHITATLTKAKRELEKQRLADCETILQTMCINLTEVRAFLFNFDRVNDYGIQVDFFGNEVDMCQNSDAIRPWSHRIDNGRLPKGISHPSAYAGRSPVVDNPNVLRLQMKDGYGSMKITSNNHDYIKALIKLDLTANADKHDIAFSYLKAAQPGNALLFYADFICRILAEQGCNINPVMTTFTADSRALKPGHFYLNYLTVIQCSTTAMEAYRYGRQMVKFIANLVKATDNTEAGQKMFNCMFDQDTLTTYQSITGAPITRYLFDKGSEHDKVSLDEIPGLVKTKLINCAAHKLIILIDKAYKITKESCPPSFTHDIQDLAAVIVFQTTPKDQYGAQQFGTYSDYIYGINEPERRKELAARISATYNIEIPTESTLLD